MVVEPTTRDFRLERKAVKDLISNTPDGINVDELTRLAEMKGISGDDFQNTQKSLLNSGRVYYEDLGKIRYVRTE